MNFLTFKGIGFWHDTVLGEQRGGTTKGTLRISSDSSWQARIALQLYTC